MKSTGITLLLSVLSVLGTLAAPRQEIKDYVNAISQRAHQTERQWLKEHNTQQTFQSQRAAARGNKVIGPTSYWGSLYTPEGEEWMYSAVYHQKEVSPFNFSIQSVDITIYDADFNVYKTLSTTFELGENETTINSVQVAPQLTKKFFNINDAYEVMIFVHATTNDYQGHIYTKVYTLSDNSLVATLEGDNIRAINTATDAWSERYTMVFMYDKFVDDKYMLYFDVYSRAGWGGSCQLEHTFEVDYAFVSGAGDYALPLLVKAHNNQIYYALPRYEKPYFVDNFSDDITPDNHFIIDLYDSSFNLIKTTSIPVELEDGALFSFPGLGELKGHDDLTFGVYTDDEKPVYVIGVENYIASTDEFCTSIYVYDADGNRIKTLVQNADDYLQMSPVEGFEDQYCFFFANDDGGVLKLVDIIEGVESAEIPLIRDGSMISTNIDRVPYGSSYRYISSLVNGFEGPDDTVVHKMIWFNADGSFNRYDDINLGKNIALAMPNIQASAINPYLFNTTDGYEYMFLVKEYNDMDGNGTQEKFRIYTDQSEVIFEMGPDNDKDEALSSIFLVNTESTNPKLMVSYYGNNQYKLMPFDLPLFKFGGGDGTTANPYVIATVGDMKTIQTEMSANYVLACDLDFENISWKGNLGAFTGTFDGQGHTLRNLNLNGQGIFQYIEGGATVKNLNIENVTMAPEGIAGVLTGMAVGGDKNGSSISNVHINNVNVNSNADVAFGTITGTLVLFSSINGCTVTDADIVCGNRATVGGLVGQIGTSSTITNSMFEGTLKGLIAGGLCGASTNGDERLTNNHVNVNIEALTTAGGIIGESGRSIINNCYVDGTIKSIGTKEAYAGGITGWMKSTYEDITEMVIDNCIVNAKVSVNTEAPKAIAHRIAGFTSGDEMLVNWDSKDPSVNWEDPSTYPYVPGFKEKAIGNNYALNMDKIDATVEDIANSTEGLGITNADLTSEFLKEHNWALGTSESEPWKLAGTALALYYEEITLEAAPLNITINETANETTPATITFVSDRRYAGMLDVKSSDEAIASISKTTVSADGKTLTCYIVCNAKGTCNIEATLGELKATCNVTASPTSSITDVNSDANAIAYNGNTLTSEGNTINVYNAAGALVATDYETVSVAHLASGVYIAVSGEATLKFAK